MWSNKIHNSGVIIISWILPTGLNIEHTSMYITRTTETRLVELWGELLKKKQPITIHSRTEQRDLPRDLLQEILIEDANKTPSDASKSS